MWHSLTCLACHWFENRSRFTSRLAFLEFGCLCLKRPDIEFFQGKFLCGVKLIWMTLEKLKVVRELHFSRLISGLASPYDVLTYGGYAGLYVSSGGGGKYWVRKVFDDPIDFCIGRYIVNSTPEVLSIAYRVTNTLTAIFDLSRS